MIPATRPPLRSATAGFSLIALFAFTACDNAPAQGKQKVSARAPTEEPAEQREQSRTVELAFDESQGSVGFVGAKITGKHEGAFEDFSGKVTLVDGDPEKSQVRVTIRTTSVQVEPEKLENHLRSSEFFDVERFPTATFVSTAIAKGGPADATHTVTGNLELHGVKKSISFPANITLKDDLVSIDSEFAINRKDFGIVYPGMPDDLIQDDVLIKLKVHPKKS